MMIRKATLDDVPLLMLFADWLEDESARYKRLGVNKEKVVSHFTAIIENEDIGVILLAEQNGVVLGGFAGGVYSDWMTDSLLTFDYVNYVMPECRGLKIGEKLVAEFVKWSKQRGAKLVQCGTATGITPDKTIEMYKRCGFREQGRFLEMEI